MEIYDYYKERYPQFDWESLNHHGFHMAIMKIGLCKTHERDRDGGLYDCEIVDNQIYGYLGTTGIKVKGYIDKEVEKEFIRLPLMIYLRTCWKSLSSGLQIISLMKSLSVINVMKIETGF